MSANFTPDMTGYKGLSPFRFWCQKTLPLVYDDSLSYYELLCKVVSYINNLISDVAAAEENVDKLLTAYNQLQEYVNEYFDGADFQQKIDDSLDRYAEDGTLSRMVNTHVSALLPHEVGQQIGPVVDEDLGPVVDLKLPAVVESKIAAPVANQLPAVVQTQIGGVVGNQIGDVVADQIDEVVADQITDAVSPLVHDEVTGLIRPAVSAELPAALQVYLPPEVQTQLPGAIGTDLETIAPPVIEGWLDAHPEATTSVPDGSISFSKLATDLQRRAGIVGTYFPSDFTNEYAWQVNQYAVYQGIVYRCIKTTTAGQAWNASEWTTANMNSDLFYMWWCLNYLSQSITTIDSSPATTAHEAGEYFIYYDGAHLYRLAKASSNIAVGDTLTPNGNFIYSSVANMIADLKVEIADLKSALNIYGNAFDSTPPVLNTQTFYISSDGASHNSPSWTSVILKISNQTSIRKIVAATNTAGFLSCAFYSSETISSDTFISGIPFTTTGEEEFDWIEVPSNAVICVISTRTSTQEYYAYEFVSVFDLQKFYDDVKTIDVLHSEYAVFDRGYVLSNGTYVFQHYWNMIKFNCENVEVLTKVKGQSNGSSINIVSFYADTDMTQYISGLNYKNISGDTVNTVYNVAVPNNAKLCVITSNSFEQIEIIARLKSEENSMKKLIDDYSGNQLRNMFKDVLCDNDFTVVDDELWCGKIVSVDTGETTINIYKMDKNKNGITYYRSINTDFNHLNVFSYNPSNDCLLFSNSSNDASTVGNWFAIVKNPKSLGSTAELANVGIIYNVDVGYKVNAFWGDADLGENNIIYLVSNGISTITKLMLNKTNGEYDGTYTVLATFTNEENGYIGGGCYWNNHLYIGDGVSLGYRILNLSDHSYEMVNTQYYVGDALLNGTSQGIHIDNKYFWRMLNKGGVSNNWILQYYR